MNILTLENTAFPLNEIPDDVDDLRFAILDNSDAKNPDYFFVPLIFLESFSSPALVLDIGGHKIKMPKDWQVVIGEAEIGDLEVFPLIHLNDRGFSAFTFNPLENQKPHFYPIDVVDVYQNVKWYFPKLKPGQLLAVPITDGKDGKKPVCAYFVKDISRTSEVIDFAKCW